MTLKEQNYVCALARCQSFSKAAEELFISQPALSIYISKLEKNLGAELFTRKDKKLVLTYTGKCYVEKAKKMLRLENEFTAQLAKIKGERAGLIRIGMQLRRTACFYAPLLAAFKKEYPSVEVELVEGIHTELENAYNNDEIDLLLCNNADKRGDSEMELICQERLLVALPPTHFANALAKEVQGDKYKKLPLNCLEGETSILQGLSQGLRRSAEKAMRQEGVQPGKVITVSNIETAMQLVGENIGVGFNRETYAKHMYYNKKVMYYSIGDPPYQSDFSLLYKKTLKFTPYMTRMIELIKVYGK